jgi:plastocyanin
VEGDSGMVAGRRAALVAAAAVAVVLLAGCGGADPDSPANVQPSPKATVVFTDGAYVPARVRVEAGSRVTFVNRSANANTAETDGVGFFELDREALDDRNLFDIHTLRPGEAESIELDTPGRYSFHSSFDSRMKGVIEVVEPRR